MLGIHIIDSEYSRKCRGTIIEVLLSALSSVSWSAIWWVVSHPQYRKRVVLLAVTSYLQVSSSKPQEVKQSYSRGRVSLDIVVVVLSSYGVVDK